MPLVGDRQGLGLAVSVFSLASGFSALVYEVLWLRELGVLFGNTAHASAIGFSVFFAGLAAGSRFWGGVTLPSRSALRLYAWMEIGIACTAMLPFGLLAAYRAIYAPLLELTGDSTQLVAAAKIALATTVLFPPAFLMGGTVPVLGQLTISRMDALGWLGARLYALNTAGAAAGALAAGFYLPAMLGFRRAYLAAMLVNALIGLAAFGLAPTVGASIEDRRNAARGETGASLDRRLGAFAAASGILMLALEVASTRLFAQVLQNSVYTFATILVVFLLSLSAGSWLASRLAARTVAPWRTLAIVLSTAGVAIAAIPSVFHRLTSGLQYLAAGEGWTAYLGSVFTTAFMVLALPCAAAGIVFPFLLRLAQSSAVSAGLAIGTLSACNTVGAIVGSSVGGFVLLPIVGMLGSFQLIALAYLLLGILALQLAPAPVRSVVLGVPAIGLVMSLTLFDPRGLTLVRLNAAAEEKVLEVIESAYGVTAVVQRGRDRRIKVNNYYSLGGSGSVEHERNQVLLPLMAHPAPRSVFFIGMGTGITAGAAVQPPVERIVVAELIPEVVAVARRYFGDLANGLFTDPRVRILTGDGRNHLATTRERHDLIVADLFVPWEAGTGSLYTLEHFTAVRERLTSGGAFVQWLPLYQTSRAEFMTIARTMLAAFPDVTVWRGDFFPERPIVALVGSSGLAPLDPDAMAERGRQISGGRVAPDAARALTLPFYAGHLSRAAHLVPDGPLNTDDRPIVEYAAPITQREQRAGSAAWFTSVDLLAFLQALLDAAPPENDPYLARLNAIERDWVRAGLHFHAAAIYRAANRADLARREARLFESRMPTRFRPVEQEEPRDRREEWEAAK